jgi:hypothetical protein
MGAWAKRRNVSQKRPMVSARHHCRVPACARLHRRSAERELTMLRAFIDGLAFLAMMAVICALIVFVA